MIKDLYSDSESKVGAAVRDLFNHDMSFKSDMLNIWRRCINFSNGTQSIGQSGLAEEINGNQSVAGNSLSRFSKREYHSNEIEAIVRTLVSFITRSKPSVSCVANNINDYESKQRAKMSEKFLEVKYQIDGELANSRMAAYWAMNLGTVWRKDVILRDQTSKIEIPLLNENGEPIIGRDGKVMVQPMAIGRSASSIRTPLNISCDLDAETSDNYRFIMDTYIAPVDWVKQNFNIKEKGYTGKTDKVKPSDSVGESVKYREEIRRSIPYRNFDSSNYTRTEDTVQIHEMYAEPTADHPKGRMIVCADDVVLYVGDSPYFNGGDKPLWDPFTQWDFEPCIGRVIGKGLVEQIVGDQIRVNEIRLAILENANTVAKPSIMAAEGTLKRGVINGQGANVYSYDWKPGVPPPQMFFGASLPPQFFEELQATIDSMVRRAGTNFVMQGSTPKGVTAAQAIEALMDNAQSQHSVTYQSFEHFHELGFEAKLRINRKLGSENLVSKDFDSYMSQLSDEFSEEDVINFLSEDIGSDVRVKVEPDSMLPKTDKVKRETYIDLAAKGLLDPEISQPTPKGAILRARLLNRIGEDEFEIDENIDLKKQQWENDQMKMGKPMQVWDKDNDIVHLQELYREMKNPTFIEGTSDQIKQLFFQHAAEHEASMEQKQAAEMQKQQDAEMQKQIAMNPNPQG